MYDTEKRVELVKKRMYEYRRRKERHRVYHLSALCSLLFLSLAYINIPKAAIKHRH
mgnify:CR=1 FL=1